MEDDYSVAFVFIDCNDDATHIVKDELKNIDIVKEIVMLKNVWKIIIKLEAENMHGIRDAIQWKIRKIPEIKTTLTLVEYMK